VATNTATNIGYTGTVHKTLSTYFRAINTIRVKRRNISSVKNKTAVITGGLA